MALKGSPRLSWAGCSVLARQHSGRLAQQVWTGPAEGPAESRALRGLVLQVRPWPFLTGSFRAAAETLLPRGQHGTVRKLTLRCYS